MRMGRIPETCDVSDTCPDNVPREIQLLAIAKQPAAMVRPAFRVEVAVPVCAKFNTESPPAKVEVAAVLVALKSGAVTVPVKTPAPYAQRSTRGG